MRLFLSYQKQEKKLISIYSVKIVEVEDYIGDAIYQYHSSPLIVLPSISTGGEHVLELLVRNDSKKKVCFKKKMKLKSN